MIRIYDDRGEKVAVLCGLIPFPPGPPYTPQLSPFTLDPTGAGGVLTISLNGQIIAVWDGRDAKGHWVPNGVYHFVIEDHPAEGKDLFLERDAFVATDQGEKVALSAKPNVAQPGDSIHFTASFAGNPAEAPSKISLYAVSGELIQTLAVSNGMASWDLTSSTGHPVASGIYLAVLSGTDPVTDRKGYRIIRLLVNH
jgi:hypothetical protein